jgi:hypothetical protein
VKGEKIMINLFLVCILTIVVCTEIIVLYYNCKLRKVVLEDFKWIENLIGDKEKLQKIVDEQSKIIVNLRNKQSDLYSQNERMDMHLQTALEKIRRIQELHPEIIADVEEILNKTPDSTYER